MDWNKALEEIKENKVDKDLVEWNRLNAALLNPHVHYDLQKLMDSMEITSGMLDVEVDEIKNGKIKKARKHVLKFISRRLI